MVHSHQLRNLVGVCFWFLRSHTIGCAASTAEGFGYLMSSSTFFTILGMSIYKIGILRSTWCVWWFFGSSGECQLTSTRQMTTGSSMQPASGFGTEITATTSPELKRLLGPAAYNSVKRSRRQRHKVCTDAVDFSDCLFGQRSIFAFNE